MIFTVGHSTLQPDGFVALLALGPVDLVWDVRSYPVSRWTWFRREALEVWLPEAGVGYRWVEDLGGRRGRPPGEPARREPQAGSHSSDTASGWREPGFVNYQWHTTTPAFFAAADELMGLGRRRNVAIMCAEGVWWRCHRSMIADYLTAAGVEVVHLQPRRTLHGDVIGDRLERYEAAVLDAWRHHLAAGPDGFGEAAATGM